MTGCASQRPPPSRISEEVAADVVARVINTVVMPLTCVTGIFAATVCIIVFTRRQMRSSLHVYLAGLSFFDLILLTMSLLIYPSLQMCIDQGYEGPVCRFFWTTALGTYPISLIAQTGSVWTCVAVTVDRYLAIRYPLQQRLWCTPAKAMVTLSLIATASIIYKLPSVMELRLNECGQLGPTELRFDPLYVTLYVTYGYVLVMLALPWSLMLTLNCYIVREVHKAYTARRALGGNQARSEDRERRCTVMALVMVLTFIVCNTFAGVNNVIEAFGHPSPKSLRIPIGNLLVCINSASNIVIYSLFAKRFRRLCLALICPSARYRSLMPTIAGGNMQTISEMDPSHKLTKLDGRHSRTGRVEHYRRSQSMLSELRFAAENGCSEAVSSGTTTPVTPI